VRGRGKFDNGAGLRALPLARKAVISLFASSTIISWAMQIHQVVRMKLDPATVWTFLAPLPYLWCYGCMPLNATPQVLWWA